MEQLVTPASFLQDPTSWTVVDVRSPGEYAHAHIPGAVSVPLFTDEERAQVGTTYKQKSQHEAVLLGLEFVGTKMRPLAEQLHALAQRGKPLLIQCWRGGMRSESMAWLASRLGLEVFRLEGGYKGFRRLILNGFQTPKRLLIVSGPTGSGKTELLHIMREKGAVMIDLEGLAHHRGSAFGSFGLPEQPRQQQFENQLGMEWYRAPADQPLWLEGESRRIGQISIPLDVWEQMSRAQVFHLDVPVAQRVVRLLDEYGDFDIDLMRDAIDRIQKRLGGVNTVKALALLDQRDLTAFTELLLRYYYDSMYEYSLTRREEEKIQRLPCDATRLDLMADELIEQGKCAADPSTQEPTSQQKEASPQTPSSEVRG